MPVSLIYFALALSGTEVQTVRLEERVVQLQGDVQQIRMAVTSMAGREADAYKALVAYTQDRTNGPVARSEFDRHTEQQKQQFKEMDADIRLISLLVKSAGLIFGLAIVLLGWFRFRVKVGIDK